MARETKITSLKFRDIEIFSTYIVYMVVVCHERDHFVVSSRAGKLGIAERN
jgi:hypothetical protein